MQQRVEVAKGDDAAKGGGKSGGKDATKGGSGGKGNDAAKGRGKSGGKDATKGGCGNDIAKGKADGRRQRALVVAVAKQLVRIQQMQGEPSGSVQSSPTQHTPSPKTPYYPARTQAPLQASHPKDTELPQV